MINYELDIKDHNKCVRGPVYSRSGKEQEKKGDGISGLYGLGLSVNSSSGADFV